MSQPHKVINQLSGAWCLHIKQESVDSVSVWQGFQPPLGLSSQLKAWQKLSLHWERCMLVPLLLFLLGFQ